MSGETGGLDPDTQIVSLGMSLTDGARTGALPERVPDG
jgi:hypothetical protein